MPDILGVFRGSPSSFAILMVTGSKSFRNVAQHRALPHGPNPPKKRVSSRTPICLNSMRAFEYLGQIFDKLPEIYPAR